MLLLNASFGYAVPTALSQELHNLSHVNFKLKEVDATVMDLRNQPNDDPSDYMQSIVMFYALPLSVFFFWLTIEFALNLGIGLVRCCRGAKPPALGPQKRGARMFLLLLLLAGLAGSVFMLSDKDVDNGLDNGLRAYRRAKVWYRDITQAGDALDADSRGLVAEISELEQAAADAGYPLPPEQAQHALEARTGLATAADQAADYAVQLRKVPMDDPEDYLDDHFRFRVLSIISASFFLLLVIVVGVVGGKALERKCLVILIDLVLVVLLITSATAASLSFSASVMLADLCQRPVENSVYISAQYLVDEPLHLIEYYVSCGGSGASFPLADRLDAIGDRFDAIQSPLTNLQAHLHGLGQPDLEQRVDAILERLYGDASDPSSGSMRGAVDQLEQDVLCPAAHQELQRFQRAACDPVVSGLVSVAVAAGVLTALGLFLRCTTTNLNFSCCFRGKSRSQQDDDDVQGGFGNSLNVYEDTYEQRSASKAPLLRNQQQQQQPQYPYSNTYVEAY